MSKFGKAIGCFPHTSSIVTIREAPKQLWVQLLTFLEDTNSHFTHQHGCLNVSGTRMAPVDMKNLMRPQLYTQSCASQGVLRAGEMSSLGKSTPIGD